MNPDPKSAPALTDFYKIGLRANFLALVGILVMNIATPVEFVFERIHDLVIYPWALVLVTRMLLLGLVTLAASLPYLAAIRWVLTPVLRCSRMVPMPESLARDARLRILNLPFTMVRINLALWVAIPVLFFFVFLHLDLMRASTAAAFALRTTMVGMISSALIFFQLESHARKTLVPVFFPQGRLFEVSGTRHLSVERRIRAFYRMGTLLPLAHIVLTLFMLYLQVDTNPMDTHAFARAVLLFALVVFCLFFLGSGILTRMITRSITEPVNEMLAAIKTVRQGDYATRVKVVSNDEIGILGDAFNRTIQGLGERRLLRDTFGRYVDPRIRDKILSGSIPTDGEYREVTILFADLRDFTPLTAARPPKEVVVMLNAYFKAMDQAVRACNGLILQFLGDEIYAVFGAPVPSPTHPADAVRAAMAMETALEGLNRELEATGFSGLAHGIGIHTGQVVAANIGSPDRLSYLLVGETVNLASRLQTLTRDLDTSLVVSGKTLSLLPDQGKGTGLVPFKDPVTVKGSSQPMTVFIKPRA